MSRIRQFLVEIWTRLIRTLRSSELHIEGDKSDSQREELKSLDTGTDAPLLLTAPPAPTLPLVFVETYPILPLWEADGMPEGVAGVDLYVTGLGRVMRAVLTEWGVLLYGNSDWVAECKRIEAEHPVNGTRTYTPLDGTAYLFALLERFDSGRKSAYYPGGVYAVEASNCRKAV